jgi:hypothetical protein
MQKKLAGIVVGVVGVLLCEAGLAVAVDYPRQSPKATVSQTVGVTDVTIAYCRPSVRGRIIWGGLVPLDKVWRAGANEATTITFGDEVTIEGAKIPAGTYGLFAIPGATEWTMVLNKGAKQWGAYSYKEADDVLRFKVKPQEAPFQELMTFSFPSVAVQSAEVALAWEKVRVAFTVNVATVDKVLTQARAAVGEAKPDDFQTPLRAAMFCLDNNVNLDEAGVWIDKSIAVKEGMYNLASKARLLAAKGQKAEALATAKKAIAVGKAQDPKADTAMVEGLIADWEKK